MRGRTLDACCPSNKRPAIRQGMGEDGVLMYEWFERTGYDVDRAALASAFPGMAWTSFEDWARHQPGLGA